MGGPRITENAKRLIIDIWTNLSKSGKEPTVKHVLAVAEAYIKRSDRKDIFLPKLRKTQIIIAEARKHLGELSEADKAMQEPWTLSTLDKYPIPSESIPAVLSIWRYSINLGTPLTIREAKWASRLYAQVGDNTELWLFSRLYSHEEELSLLSKTPMRIFDLDSQLVMGHWEVKTIKVPEWIQTGIIIIGPSSVVFLAEDGGIIEEFLYSLPCDIFNSDIDYAVEFSFYLVSLISSLPSSVRYFPDIETRMVYLRHLSHLSNGANWSNFKPEELRDIVVDLRKWVIETKANIDKENSSKRANPYPFHNIRLSREAPIINREHYYPVDIYQRAGCEIDSFTRRFRNERSHSQEKQE